MNLLKITTIIIILVSSMKASAYVSVVSAKQVVDEISSIEGKNIVILFDIDDTIITPKSLTFRKEPYNKIIDKIKENRLNYPNYEAIISNWRLERKVILTDQNWPKLLNDLKKKYQIFALTKVNTGSLGNIPSMEEWRYKELLSLNIQFSLPKTEFQNDGNDQPSFFKGIMMTGSATKGDTLQKYLPALKPMDTIVFIDDREQALKEIEKFCQEHKIKFVGLHYQGLKKLDGKQSDEIFQLQYDTLIRDAKWLEDEDAQILLTK